MLLSVLGGAWSGAESSLLRTSAPERFSPAISKVLIKFLVFFFSLFFSPIWKIPWIQGWNADVLENPWKQKHFLSYTDQTVSQELCNFGALWPFPDKTFSKASVDMKITFQSSCIISYEIDLGSPSSVLPLICSIFHITGLCFSVLNEVFLFYPIS